MASLVGHVVRITAGKVEEHMERVCTHAFILSLAKGLTMNMQMVMVAHVLVYVKHDDDNDNHGNNSK